MTATTTPDTEATLASLLANPIFGGTAPVQRGIGSTGDALGGQTIDGVTFDSIWQDVIDGFEEWNKHRTSITSLLGFPTTVAGEPVAQGVSSPSFEELTEYGVPNSANVPASALMLGYTLKDYGIRCDFTWRALRKMTAAQVNATINGVMHSDNRLTTGLVLRRLFDPAEYTNAEGFKCKGLYNADGQIPPDYLGNSFDGSATHYWKSGAAVVDSGDLEDAIKTIRAKGYGLDATSQLLILANSADSERIQTFRQGEESRAPVGPETDGPIAKHSFIPSKRAPAYLQAENIVGEPIDGDYYGIECLGSYGPAWLVETAFIPSGYIAVVATSGPNSERNVIGFREHPLDIYRGLLVQPGGTPFPLVGSEYVRLCGVGTRQRGAAVAIQIGTGSVYAAPTIAI